MTTLFNTITEWREFRKSLDSNLSLGFVPTLGNLHAGHASLLRQSINNNHKTVLSIFINPTQFNNPNDLAQYPKTFTEDFALAESLGVDYVFTPTADEIYADGYH